MSYLRFNALLSTALWRDQCPFRGNSWQHEAFNLDLTLTVQTKLSQRSKPPTSAQKQIYTPTAKFGQNPRVINHLTNNSVDRTFITHVLVFEKNTFCLCTNSRVVVLMWPGLAGRACKWSWQTAQRWMFPLHLPKVIRQTAEVATEHRAESSLSPYQAPPSGKRNIEALPKSNQVVVVFFLARKLEHLKLLSSSRCEYLCSYLFVCVPSHSVVCVCFRKGTILSKIFLLKTPRVKVCFSVSKLILALFNIWAHETAGGMLENCLSAWGYFW